MTDRAPYRPNARHEEAGMVIPAPYTCGDCVHIRRCQLIYGHIPLDRVCDWSPSRFQLSPSRLEVRE